MRVLERDNCEEILMLLINFYNGNCEYTEQELKPFIKDNRILQDVDYSEVIEALEYIKDYMEALDEEIGDRDIPYVEDKESVGDEKRRVKLRLRKATIFSQIKDISFKELKFRDVIDWVKGVNYKRLFKQTIRSIGNGVKKAKPYIVALGKGLRDSFIEFIKRKPNLNKQILLYKKVVQKELDKARNELDKVSDDKRVKYGNTIHRLTLGDGVIPKLNFSSNLKLGALGMFYDLRILLLFLITQWILIAIITGEFELVFMANMMDVADFIILMAIYISPFIMVFLRVYSFIIYLKLRNHVAGSMDLRNFMWDEFPYGNGLLQTFYSINKNQYSVEENLGDFDDMELGEIENLIKWEDNGSNTSKSNNPYSKEWEEIFEELFNIKGDFDVPEIMKINERTEVHVINHKNIDFSKVKRKREEIRQYLGKEIYQIIPDYGNDIRQVGVEIITKPIPDKYSIYDIPKPSKKSCVVMGLGVKGWVEWDLENPDSAHGLLVGGTGSGKSRLMYHLIKQFIEQDFLLLFGDYKKLTFGRYSKRGYRVATENIEIANILGDLQEEMIKRNVLFLEKGVEKLSEYNSLHPESPLPRIIFIIDEFATFSSDTEIFDGKGGRDEQVEGAYKDYENILRVGRSAGIHLLIALQDPLATSIGGQSLQGKARNLFDYKLCGRIPREEYSEMVLGKGDTRASKINRFGKFYVNETSKDTAYEIVSPIVDSDTVVYLTENTPFNKYRDYIVGSSNSITDQIKDEVVGEPKETIDISKENKLVENFDEKSAKDYY